MQKILLFSAAAAVTAGCASNEVLLEKNEIADFGSPYDVEAWEITYESDGYEIEGYVVSAAQEETSPVLIVNRGGNRSFGEVTEEELAHRHAYWADQGYTVIASQFREGGGSEGSDDFGGDDVQDVLQLEHVAEEIAFADEEEMYMFGLSRGGIMTYRAIEEGMPIQAAAVLGGVTDLDAAYEERTDMRQMLNELIGHPAEEPEEYERRSAMAWPEAIQSPMLLLHGEADEQVSVNQAVELYEALQEQEQEVKLVTYEDGDHSLEEFADQYHHEIAEWFRLHQKEE